MAGITNIKEAIAAIAALYKEIKSLGADGFQIGDAVALLEKYQGDPAFAKKLEDGIMGWELIGSEIADIGLLEGLDLLKTLSAEFKK